MAKVARPARSIFGSSRHHFTGTRFRVASRVSSMGRIRGHYEWDDDHLTPGQKKEGGLHQNLFDSDGNLKGSARFIPDDRGEPDPIIVTETIYVPIEERRRTREEEELSQAIAEL